MSRTSRISVVVPVLDEAATLAASLAPLQAGREAGHEVIVADGGSADDSAGVAAPMADAVVHSGRGRAVQMNAGAERASGDVLLFLHADTMLPAGWAAEVAGALEAPGRAWGRFDVRLSGARRALRVVETAMNLRSRWSGIATGDQAMFVRGDTFRALGGFPPIALMEDLALSTALLRRHGRPACLRSRVLTSSRRWERDGVVRTVLTMWGLRLAYWAGARPERLAGIYHASRS